MQNQSLPVTVPASGAISLDDLRSVEEMVAENPRHLTISGLRWQLRHRDRNGLGVACVRLGKKLLISKARYEQWLATQTDTRVQA